MGAVKKISHTEEEVKIKKPEKMSVSNDAKIETVDDVANICLSYVKKNNVIDSYVKKFNYSITKVTRDDIESEIGLAIAKVCKKFATGEYRPAQNNPNSLIGYFKMALQNSMRDLLTLATGVEKGRVREVEVAIITHDFEMLANKRQMEVLGGIEQFSPELLEAMRNKIERIEADSEIPLMAKFIWACISGCDPNEAGMEIGGEDGDGEMIASALASLVKGDREFFEMLNAQVLRSTNVLHSVRHHDPDFGLSPSLKSTKMKMDESKESNLTTAKSKKTILKYTEPCFGIRFLGGKKLEYLLVRKISMVNGKVVSSSDLDVQAVFNEDRRVQRKQLAKMMLEKYPELKDSSLLELKRLAGA